MILSIVMAVAGVDFEGLTDRSGLKTSVRELVTDIRYAQQIALGSGKNCYVLFDTDRELYRIKIGGHPEPEIIKQVVLREGIDIETSYKGQSLHFTPIGAPSIGGTIMVCNSRGACYRITILPATGRVKVYKEE